MNLNVAAFERCMQTISSLTKLPVLAKVIKQSSDLQRYFNLQLTVEVVDRE